MKHLLYLVLLLPAMALAQSTTQNYVKSTAYKVPTQNGITATDGSGPVTDAKKAINVAYFDGLGRPIQQVAHRQSGTGTDIVTPIKYDNFGRQTHEYLPYASQTPSMDYNPSAVGSVLSFYDTEGYGYTANPYSKKRLEASPLNRVLEQGAPGVDWAVDSLSDGDHTIKFGYHTNTAGDAVKHFKATATLHPTTLIYNIALVNGAGTTFYQANQLYKTITRDENWKPVPIDRIKLSTTEEFKNKKGQVVLKRTYNMVDGTVTPHDTYYVYDQFDNLTYVVPPLATGSITTKLDGLCYQYKYDSRNRLVEKKLPGKQWEYIVYDKLDRVVATGPALSPFSNFVAPNNTGWLITKYDAFNRPILTAWKQASVTGSTRKTLQELYNGATATTISEKRTTSPTVNTTMNGVAFNYTNVAEPKTGYHVLTINYYDDYAFTPATSWVPAALPTSSLSDPVHYNHTLKPKGLATGSWVRVLESSTGYRNERSYMLYDKKARMVMSHKVNHLFGYTKALTKYDFEGKVLQTQTAHKGMDGSSEVLINDYYTYTDQGRLLEHRHKINSGQEELIARNEYDDLGQLKSKRVGGPSTGQGHQKVDYTYNIRGWLKGINDIDDLVQGNTNPANPKDLFAFKLNYNTVENSVEYTVEELYNGNISESFWISNSDNTKRKYGYVYDNLSRLTEAIYQKPDLGNPAQEATNAYNEDISYDRNGNILTLKRNGYQDNDNGYYYPIDNLVYTYSDNQLKTVVEQSNSFNGFKDGKNPDAPDDPDYEYDGYGNMLQDWNKGISNITYNHLNLPTKIEFGKNGLKQIDYLYNALGVKLKKVVNDKTVEPSTYQQTDYLDGFQYVDDKLQFFPTGEGYVSVIDNEFRYVYHYTDHLGNIRLSYSQPKVGYPVEVLEENHYYPFGMKHSNYAGEKYKYVKENNSDGFIVLEAVERSNYQYKYNGKELQDELGLGWYDYQARNYDPAIGRWMNIDPLAEKSRRFSPYTYALNNPVFFIDPDGMEATANDWYPDKNGNLIAEAGDNTVTLAKYLDVSVAEAASYKSVENGKVTNEEKGADHEYKKGDVVLQNNSMAKDVQQYNKTGVVEDISCHQAVYPAVNGKEINETNASVANSLDSIIVGLSGKEASEFKKGYEQAGSSKDATFGKTIGIFGDSAHSAVYYGTSKDGTNYYYSKNGNSGGSSISKESDLIKNYGEVKYYNPVK